MKEDRIYLVLDPGKDKVGVVLGRDPVRIIYQGVLPREEMLGVLRSYMKRYPGLVLILGDGTASKDLKEEMIREGGFGGEIFFIDESYSSEEGRILYFQENPPQGWRRFLPRSLLYPPSSFDDYAARILLKRFFLNNFKKKKDS